MPAADMQSPGLEADDIIATLAVRALREGLHVTIASPDKVRTWMRISDNRLLQPHYALVMSGLHPRCRVLQERSSLWGCGVIGDLLLATRFY